jgi:hypothetical protein
MSNLKSKTKHVIWLYVLLIAIQAQQVTATNTVISSISPRFGAFLSIDEATGSILSAESNDLAIRSTTRNGSNQLSTTSLSIDITGINLIKYAQIIEG